MTKRVLALFLTVILAVTCLVTFAAADGGFSILYVKTANGKPVNVRSGPGKEYPAIGSVPYGGTVTWDWSYAGNDGWTKVVWGGAGDGYIMSRFLTETKPGPAPKPKEEKEKEEENERQKLANENASEKAVSEPYYIAVVATRASGWINFRTGPSKTTKRISSFADGKELIVIGETTNWYKAKDPETEKVGYIHKNFARKLNKQVIVQSEASDGKQSLGKLNVNGEFDLTCKLPEGYKLQVINIRGDKIIASVVSDDMTKPQLYLSIAYDETYGEIERINDMNDDDLSILEESFKDMNDVAISYAETGYGTKLLIARETGSDTDFVDILAIYKGYFIEFNMTPNPAAADQTLTDEQIQMCIDFLTNVDFVPVQK